MQGLRPQHVDSRLTPSKVFVGEDDEAKLLDELQQCLPYSARKIKPGFGRSMVPQELSLFEVSSEGEHDIEDDAQHVMTYVVKHMFL